MFLTKMQLNPRRRGAQKLLASPQAMHAAVLAGFPDARPAEDGRVLWRVDTYATHRVLLFIVSPDKPDLQHLVEQAGWPTTHAWQTAAYDGLLGSLRAGQQWQFRLTANPVRSGRRKGWESTKPLGHVTVAQQQQWLLDRARSDAGRQERRDASDDRVPPAHRGGQPAGERTCPGHYAGPVPATVRVRGLQLISFCNASRASRAGRVRRRAAGHSAR
ncbi:type I-E CRISPR-associated protein Cas6/Cse3/CasE [Amycolatopsis sp. cg9]|uniref:type I-E CRISPR-associated protein Cas6/Cse3/CasE n=1 Tax=Amycolatopsis sp. cg9 TaxID=3238801 RepID=UPI003524FDCD